MEKIKTTVSLVLPAFCLTTLLFTSNISSQILQVSSVSVDSCWNSDSSWYDSNGIKHTRTSRDCRISFTPQGEGKARMFIAMSIDSGKTWTQSSNLLSVKHNALASTFTTGRKATITVRVLGGDQPGTVFKMIARQAAPVIAGNPKNVMLGLTTVLKPGQSVGALMNLRIADTTSTNGFSTISKVYWEALGDGKIDDSTMGTNVLSWTWLTQVPAGTLGQKRGMIAKAMDKNGLWSAPETLAVQFGFAVDSVTDIDGNVYHTVKIGTQEWTMENLRVTRYNDGTAIPKDTSSVTWGKGTTPKYCYHGNTTNADSIKIYGALYNWYVVASTNPKKIAPAGWHVPSYSEWTILEKYLVLNGYNYDGTTDTSVDNKIAKSLAGQMRWVVTASEGAIGNDLTKNNSSGFSAIGGGYRLSNGDFYTLGYFGNWWSSTADETTAWYCLLNNEFSYMYINNGGGTTEGYSVRLVRD